MTNLLSLNEERLLTQEEMDAAGDAMMAAGEAGIKELEAEETIQRVKKSASTGATQVFAKLKANKATAIWALTILNKQQAITEVKAARTFKAFLIALEA